MTASLGGTANVFMMMCWLHKIHCKQKTAAENKPLKRIQLQIAPSVFLVVRVKYSMLMQSSSLLPKKKREPRRRGWRMVGCTCGANMERHLIPFWRWRARTHLRPSCLLALFLKIPVTAAPTMPASGVLGPCSSSEVWPVWFLPSVLVKNWDWLDQ